MYEQSAIVKVCYDDFSVVHYEISGIYIYTNHLLHMTD